MFMGMVFKKSGRFFGTSPRIKRAVYLLAIRLYRQNCAKMAKIAQSESTSHFKRFLAFHVFHVRCKILSVHLFQNKKLSVRFRPKLTIFVTAASSSQSQSIATQELRIAFHLAPNPPSPRESSASRFTSPHALRSITAPNKTERFVFHRRSIPNEPSHHRWVMPKSRSQATTNALLFLIGQLQKRHRIFERFAQYLHNALRHVDNPVSVSFSMSFYSPFYSSFD